MKSKLLLVLVLFGFVLSGVTLAADTSGLQTDLRALISQIQTKLRAGKDTEKDFADELKQFSALVDKHRSEKTAEVAQAAAMEATLYMQLGNTDKAVSLMRQAKTDFPETEVGKNADQMIAAMEKRKDSQKVQAALVAGATFPDFSVQDLAGKPLSISALKGKVVLVDFWATWCGPCVAELPNVLKTYGKYHSKGFEIVGISLDQDKEKLTTFIKQKDVTWPQYFDGEGWSNKLAVKYGIESIPATFLLDGNGKIIAKDLRGENLAQAVAKALAAK